MKTNFEPEDPLYGIVSATGRTFTVHYRKRDRSCGISRTGYDTSVFADLPDGIPILRFDRAKDWPGFVPFVNGDFTEPTCFDRDIRDTPAEMAWFAEHGVPVESWNKGLGLSPREEIAP